MLKSDDALMKAASGVPCREAHDAKKGMANYSIYYYFFFL